MDRNGSRQGVVVAGAGRNDLVRYDKQIVTNLEKIEELIGSGGGGLLRSILMFISYEYQYNGINAGLLDPEVFAKKYGYDRSNLFRKVDHPVQFQDLTEEQKTELLRKEEEEMKSGKQGELSYRIFDSYLENALYILFSRGLQVSGNGEILDVDDVKGIMKGGISIQVLTGLWCVVKEKKILYAYILSEDFKKSLCSYFVKLSMKSFLALRSKSFDGLYSKLVNLKYDLLAQNPPKFRTEPDYTPSFETVCVWAQVAAFTKDGTPIEPRKRKNKLNEALKYVRENSDLYFEVQWCNGEYGRSAYIPCFIFSEHDSKEYVRKDEYDKEFKKMFKEELQRQLSRTYRELHKVPLFTVVNPDDFYAWLSDSKNAKNSNIRNAFENAYKAVYKTLPDEDKLNRLFRRFLEQISFTRIENLDLSGR